MWCLITLAWRGVRRGVCFVSVIFFAVDVAQDWAVCLLLVAAAALSFFLVQPAINHTGRKCAAQ